MRFFATEQQLKQIIFNAVEWSKPPSTHSDHLHCSPELPFKAENIKLKTLVLKGWIYINYVCGRCVKLFITKVAESCYEIENEPTSDRQTWAHKYPTNEALIKSVINSSNFKNSLECSPSEGFKDG